MITTDDVKKIIGAIKVAYPNYKLEEPQLAVDMYKAIFKDFTAEEVMMGLHRFIVTDKIGFPPSMGQIIECIISNGMQDELNEMQAWGLVSKAIRNSAWNSEAEFNKLPEPIQKAVGSSNQLNLWALDSDFNESVVQSNFMRAYKTVLNRQREDAKLPQYIKDFAITQKNVKELEDKSNGLNTKD